MHFYHFESIDLGPSVFRSAIFAPNPHAFQKIAKNIKLCNTTRIFKSCPNGILQDSLRIGYLAETITIHPNLRKKKISYAAKPISTQGMVLKLARAFNTSRLVEPD